MKFIDTGIKLKLSKSPSEMLRLRRDDRISLVLMFIALSITALVKEGYVWMSLSLIMAFLYCLSAYEYHRASKESEKHKHLIIQFKEDADREKVFNEGTAIVKEMLSRDVIESATFDMEDKTA